MSGASCVESVCNYRQTLPDLGWSSKPQRINDGLIGLVSSDPLEDVILIVRNKQEVVLLSDDLFHASFLSCFSCSLLQS